MRLKNTKIAEWIQKQTFSLKKVIDKKIEVILKKFNDFLGLSIYRMG